MDKAALKARMLALEAAELAHARAHYQDYLDSAAIDWTEPRDSDLLSQADANRDLAQAFDQPVHEHEAKLAHLQSVDFGAKSAVEEGAVLQLGDRWFVVAIPTARFEFEGQVMMGISTQAPIYRALDGATEGDTVTLGGRDAVLARVL